VKIWKFILATVVIFAAGAFAGGMWVKSFAPPAAPSPKPPIPGILTQQRFQARLKTELKLTPEQTNRVDRIFADSNGRIKIIWDLLGPEVQKERQVVYENIRAELTPEQREKFEQLLKEQHRPDGPRRPRGTNQSNAGGATVK
jgi:Spy/CpxP family protein refolding chaperone